VDAVSLPCSDTTPISSIREVGRLRSALTDRPDERLNVCPGVPHTRSYRHGCASRSCVYALIHLRPSGSVASRATTIWMRRVRQSNTTGKSLLIYVNRVKPQNKKYFAFPEARTVAYLLPSRPDKRGARDRHERGAGSGGRGSALTNGTDAYGEDVWS
jgi:hypothetical protein